jgi:hypothetical protein
MQHAGTMIFVLAAISATILMTIAGLSKHALEWRRAGMCWACGLQLRDCRCARATRKG